MQGERLSTLTDFESQKVAAAAVLLSPFLPLLFMGEEYGETAPFLYFVSHGDPQLVEAVRRGRRRNSPLSAGRGRRPIRRRSRRSPLRRSTRDWPPTAATGPSRISRESCFGCAARSPRWRTSTAAASRRMRSTRQRALAVVRRHADSAALLLLAFGAGRRARSVPPSGAAGASCSIPARSAGRVPAAWPRPGWRAPERANRSTCRGPPSCSTWPSPELRRAHGTLRLHSRTLLPAAAGEPVAGSGRAPGLRLSVPRLERADHGRVLRAQRRLADPGRARIGSRGSSTTIRGSASISARRCCPGSRRRAPPCTPRSRPRTGKAGSGSPGTDPRSRRSTTT